MESPEIARYIQQHSEPDDRIAVLGSEPQIYFYANRRSATGHIYTYGLMEQQRYSKQMQDEMIQEITAVHPKYLVFVEVSVSWLASDPKEKIFSWSQAYINQCYSLAGVAELNGSGTTHYAWDAEATAYKPRTDASFFTRCEGSLTNLVRSLVERSKAQSFQQCNLLQDAGQGGAMPRSIHDKRHTFASLLIAQGESLATCGTNWVMRQSNSPWTPDPLTQRGGVDSPHTDYATAGLARSSRSSGPEDAKRWFTCQAA